MKRNSDTPPEVIMTHRNRDLGNDLGTYLGFPPCCVAEFRHATYADLKARHAFISSGYMYPLYGTGYVPCKTCMHIDAQTLTDTINANRIFPHPFPYKGNILGTPEKEQLFEDWKASRG